MRLRICHFASPVVLSADTRLRLSWSLADEDDAAEIAALRLTVARDLTERFGRGHWSGESSERGVIAGMPAAQVWVARRGRTMIGTFRLTAKKPWAIDKSYFTKCRRPLFLTDMAVLPAFQGRGIGRRSAKEAVRRALAWPADAIYLDAYDDEAGAGPFYEKCGFRERGRVVYRGVPLVYFEMMLDVPRSTAEKE
jgi:GNAT superfamily N-acetyltransferase